MLTAMTNDTLAHRLGTTAHVSPLLKKARRLGLCSSADLCALAVHRGCSYYDVKLAPNPFSDGARVAPGKAVFTDAELGIALLIHSPVRQLCQRIGGALLGASELTAREVAELAKSVEPENLYWEQLKLALMEHPYDPLEVPHLSRFVEMTGVTRGKVELQKQWIRPIPAPVKAG